MKKLKLYLDFLSPPCRGVYMFICANQIPTEVKSINISKDQQLQNEFTKHFPLQILPAIDDNGFCIHESIAILRYLASKYKSAAGSDWYPEDLKQRAKQDEYLSWHHHNTRPVCSNYFYLKIGIKMEWRKPLFEVTLPEAEGHFYNLLQKIQDYFLQDQHYIGGARPSIADMLCFCELNQLVVVGEYTSELARHSPTVAAWMERMETKLQPDLQVANRYLMKLRDKLKNL